MNAPSLPITALRDYGDLHVVSQADDLLVQIPAEEHWPNSALWSQQKNLGCPVKSSKIDNCFSGISALEETRLDAQIAREVQLSSDYLPLFER